MIFDSTFQSHDGWRVSVRMNLLYTKEMKVSTWRNWNTWENIISNRLIAFDSARKCLVTVRRLLRMNPELATLVLLGAIWHIHREVWYFRRYTYSDRFAIRAFLFDCYSDFKISPQSRNGINSWKFSCDDLLRLSTWIILTTVHRSTHFDFWRWSTI